MNLDLLTIIVTYNSEETIKKCIESVLNNIDCDNHQVVVVDNASCDKSVKIAKTFEPKVIVIESEKNLGFGMANNLAMKRFSSEYYYLHNADAYLTHDSITPALSLLKREPKTGIVGLPLVFPDGSPQTSSYSFSSPTKLLLQMLHIHKLAKWFLSKKSSKPFLNILKSLPFGRTFSITHSIKNTPDNHMRSEIVPDSMSVDWVTGASLIMRREILECTGGFDENIFLYGEDEDLCIAARNCGYIVKQVFVEPVIHEFGWGENKDIMQISNLKLESLMYFSKKHFSGVKRIFMISLIRLKFKISQKNIL